MQEGASTTPAEAPAPSVPTKRVRIKVGASEGVWTADSLCRRLQLAVGEAGMEALDVLLSWDDDGSGELRKKEWLVNWKRLIEGGDDQEKSHQDVWEDQVRDAVSEAYANIDCSHEGSVSIWELNRWLTSYEERARVREQPRVRDTPVPSRRYVMPDSVKPSAPWRAYGRQWDVLQTYSEENESRAVQLSRILERSQRLRRRPPAKTPACSWSLHEPEASASRLGPLWALKYLPPQTRH